MDAEALLASLHGRALRLLTDRLGHTCQGLAVAARKARRAGLLDNRAAKKATQVDIAFAMVRHITKSKCEDFLCQLTQSLGGTENGGSKVSSLEMPEDEDGGESKKEETQAREDEVADAPDEKHHDDEATDAEAEVAGPPAGGQDSLGELLGIATEKEAEPDHDAPRPVAVHRAHTAGDVHGAGGETAAAVDALQLEGRDNSTEDGISKRHHRCKGCDRRLTGQPVKIFKENGKVRFFGCLPCWKERNGVPEQDRREAGGLEDHFGGMSRCRASGEQVAADEKSV